MDTTSNLGLPFIAAAQAQKHVTHNEALRALDAVVQLMVLDNDLSAPPGAPPEGARYIVAAGASGAWTGQEGQIAAFQDGAWAFYSPREEWLAWVADEAAAYVWTGSAWSTLGAGGGGISDLVEDASPQLGGDLDANGFDISFADGSGILDDSGNGQLVFRKIAGAVNQIAVRNAATGTAPRIAAEGADSNIGLDIAAKGSGTVRVPGPLEIANGAGTTIPLKVVGGGSSTSVRIAIETTSDATNPVIFYKDNSPGQARVGSFNFANAADATMGQLAYQFHPTGTSQWFRVYVNASERMRWDGSGNVLLGGTVSPTGAAKAFAIFNGTPPSGSVPDGVLLYAEDVAASSELKVRDEVGNITTLSPHNFSDIPEGPSEPMAWAYRSERDGTTISVDVLRVIRLVERLTGERLVHETMRD